MRRIGFILVLAITAMALVACADLLNTAVTGVTLNKASTTIIVGATEQLTATEAPANATNQKVSWASSDQTKATVSASGLVTAVAAGPATITVTTVDGSFTATCTVTVAAAIPVTGVTLNKTSTTIIVGATEQLTATVAPANATNQTVYWSWISGDATWGTMSATGLVSALAAGMATITVTTADGSFAATCTVTVAAAAAIPDYVGSWSGFDAFGAGTGTLTLTITTTTLHFAFAAGGSYAGSTADASLVVDETLKHMTLTVTSSTGSLVSIFPTSTVYYTTYAVTGTTVQLAMGGQAPPPFPANATGGLTLTKQ